MGLAAAAAQGPENIRPAVLITTTPTPVPPAAAAPKSPLSVTERLLSFDANKDHRISRDELPERMQGLIERGDRNADGVLDVEEIRALVSAASSQRVGGRFHPQPAEGLSGVISDLKLPPEKHARASEIVSAQKGFLNLNEPAGVAIIKAMKLLLDDEEFGNFLAAARRLARTPQIGMGAVSGLVRGLPPPAADR